MANNNGNIIGASHNSFKGVWDIDDQYQRALDGTWSNNGLWTPNDYQSNLRYWGEAYEDLTSDTQPMTSSSDGWVGSGPIANEMVANFGNISSLRDGFVFEAGSYNTAVSEYSSRLATTYHPLQFKEDGASSANFIKDETKGADSDTASISILFRCQDTVGMPICSLGTIVTSNTSANPADRMDLVTNASRQILLFDGRQTATNTGVVLSNDVWYSLTVTYDSDDFTSGTTIYLADGTSSSETTTSAGTASLASTGTVKFTNGCSLGKAQTSTALLTFIAADDGFEIMDVAIWAEELPAEIVAKIQSYHHYKYGLVSLSSSHEYYNAPARG